MLNLLLAFCLFLSGLSFNSNTSAQLEGSGFNAPIAVGRTEGPLGGLLIAVNDLSVSEEDTDDAALEESKASSQNNYESSQDKDYVSNINDVEKSLADGSGYEAALVGCGPMVRRCQPVARHCQAVARCCEPKPRRCCERPVARHCQPVARRCEPAVVARRCAPVGCAGRPIAPRERVAPVIDSEDAVDESEEMVRKPRAVPVAENREEQPASSSQSLW